MRKLILVVLAGGAILTGGCASFTMKEDTAAPPQLPSPTKYDTQVALGQCVFSKKPEAGVLAAIGSALLSSAVSQGVNHLGTALEEAAKEKEVGVLATRNVEVNHGTFGPCIHLVRGWFYLDPTNPEQKLEKARDWMEADRDFVNEDRWTKFFQNRLWLAAPPDFVFEGRFDAASSDKAALTIVPQFVQLNDPMFTRALRPEKERYVSLFFAFAGKENSLALPDKAAASIDVGRLTPGVPVEYPLPTLEGNSVNRWPHETPWFSLSLTEKTQPLTVGGYLQEKQGASAHLKFLSAVFSGAKDEVAATLQTALVPSKREEAETASANAYDDAFAGVVGSLDACGKEGTAANAANARKAMRALNAASRAQGKSRPFTDNEIEQVKMSGSPSDISAACKNVRTGLSA